MALLFAEESGHTSSMNQSIAQRRPPADTIANFVKLQRAFYGWKRETLAALAQVSLSTVERVERGETVRATSLKKLALALNQAPDAFTAERVPLSEADALATLIETFSWMNDTVPVDVAPLRHEAQLRALTDTDVSIVTSDLEGDEAACEVDGLREHLDLTSFVRAEDGTLLPKRERSFRLRALYKDVLKTALQIEHKYKAVCLAGNYEATSSTPGYDVVRVGVIAIRSREHNPAAVDIKRLMGEATVNMHEAIENYFEGMD